MVVIRQFVRLVVRVNDLVVFVRVNGADDVLVQVEKRFFALDPHAVRPTDAPDKGFQPRNLLRVPGTVDDGDVVRFAILPRHVVKHGFNATNGVNVGDIKHIFERPHLLVVPHLPQLTTQIAMDHAVLIPAPYVVVENHRTMLVLYIVAEYRVKKRLIFFQDHVFRASGIADKVCAKAVRPHSAVNHQRVARLLCPFPVSVAQPVVGNPCVPVAHIAVYRRQIVIEDFIVAVEKGDVLRVGEIHAPVPGRCRAAVFLPEKRGVGVLTDPPEIRIPAVINDNDFRLREIRRLTL